MRSPLKFLSLVAVLLCATAFAQNVDEIAALGRSGATEDAMLAKVKSAPAPYNMSAADILKLKDAHVPDSVVTAMLRHSPEGGPAVAERHAPAPANVPHTRNGPHPRNSPRLRQPTGSRLLNGRLSRKNRWRAMAL